MRYARAEIDGVAAYSNEDAGRFVLRYVAHHAQVAPKVKDAAFINVKCKSALASYQEAMRMAVLHGYRGPGSDMGDIDLLRVYDDATSQLVTAVHKHDAWWRARDQGLSR